LSIELKIDGFSAGHKQQAALLPSPGARVVIRDAEWIVRRVDNASDGGWQLTCDGVSEVVRGRTGMFLTQLDKDIQVLDPAATELVPDISPRFSSALLHIESHLRSRVPNDGRIYIGHRGAMDVVPYQLDPALQALKQHRQRILIADAVGLGKTLEAGILVSELIQRGRGARILVVTQKSMLTQFQKEFWNRFTIPLVRLDSVGLARVRRDIPSNHNPFYFYDKTIISIDTLKGDLEYRNYLENAWWDVIIIDETHNVADRGTNSQRSRLAKLLSTRSDTLILLSATPHDGRARSFASLVNMLDPTAISDPDSYTADDFRDKGLVIRRFKKDIQSQVKSAFKEREVRCERHAASPQEELAYEALLSIPFTTGGKHEGGKRGELVRIGLQKSVFSSPAAALASAANRIGVLQSAGEITPDVAREIEGLQQFMQCLEAITPKSYGKYQKLLKLLGDAQFGWSKSDTNDRLVIFSERIETLKFLYAQMIEDLRLPAAAIALLHGGLSDTEQQNLVEEFGKSESKLRVLLCSDVASEGLNLHYLSHRLVHFDMPWSLMVFQQRNGRVDRYGQSQTPMIVYLITESQNAKIRGDMRILEILQTKDQQAYENIGDPSVFMNVYDSALEEQLTEAAMVEGMSAEQFDAKYQPKTDEGEDFLSMFMNAGEETQGEAVKSSLDSIASVPSLYPSDYDFAKTALSVLSNGGGDIQWQPNDTSQRIILTAPLDLKVRMRQLPRELRPENDQFVLCSDPAQIQAEVVRCRQDENAWPKVHYLWPQHVVMEWMADRLRSSYRRHSAPVIRVSNQDAGQMTFLVAGTIPNRKGQPLVIHWLAGTFQNGKMVQVEEIGDYIGRIGLGKTPLPNTGEAFDTIPMQKLLPTAIEAVRNEVIARRDAFDKQIKAQLDHQIAELKRLRGRQFEQMELKLENSEQNMSIKERRRAERTKEINTIFDDYQKWIEDTLTTERDPYLQVIAVVAGSKA